MKNSQKSREEVDLGNCVERAKGGKAGAGSKASCWNSEHQEATPTGPPHTPELPATRTACSPQADESHGKDQRWLQTPHLPRPRCLPTTAGKEYDLRFPLLSSSHMSAPHWESTPEACWQCLPGMQCPGCNPCITKGGA